MNQMEIFSNQEFGSIRTFEQDGKVLFCGKDIAKALGYQRTADAITAHCKGVCVLPTPSNGGIQRMKFIPEGDVYRLIVHSKLPSAERFERWVFDEVLPSIRKHGAYQLTLTEEVEVRYRTETRTDSEGNSYTVEVPYNYYILNVKLTSKPISSVASELLTPEQLEMYQVYRQTLGNKPLIFGGGSTNTSDSESLEGVEFVNGTRPGNPELVELAKRQVGNVGGQPYWSWYGFNSRVEWCACFVSWCYGQMGLSEPRFAGCQSQGVPWFQSHGQWGARGYDNLAPGDAIFFDWDLDGSADHVGIVIGTDGSRVYTVEGNSGDACKIRSYDVNYECIKGYGLMNW